MCVYMVEHVYMDQVRCRHSEDGAVRTSTTAASLGADLSHMEADLAHARGALCVNTCLQVKT